MESRRIFLLVGLGYLAFVVYGSLVPFDFRPLPLDAALRAFAHIRYLKLGIDSRADWVANILLYIPLPFLWLGAVSSEGRYFRQLFFSVFFFLFFVALSVTIEFTQQFFPPRTVSLNDIIAEVFGTAIGVMIWWSSGTKIRALVQSVLAQGRNAAIAGLILYTIGYLAFSLFPYDFLISAQEIQGKLSGRYFHWFASADTCGGTLRCGAKLMAEAAAVAPLGLLIGFASRRTGWPLVRSAIWMGSGLGLIIETLQFFLVSGLTLGASVLTRAIGVAAGAAAGDRFRQTSLWPVLYLLRPFIPVTGAAYAFLLGAVTWLNHGPILTVQESLERLGTIRFVPFYYHYYTSESAAMSSLLAVAIMFFPIGIQYWIWRITRLREFVARGVFTAGFIGGAVSLAVEIGKLFLASARPDPTNVLIGALAAAAGYACSAIGTKVSLAVTPLDDDGTLE